MSGVTVFIGLVGVAAAGVAVWLWREWRKTAPGGPESHVARMKREYQRLTGLKGAAAYESLERKLERITREKPGQSMEYYMDAILKELRRDKR